MPHASEIHPFWVNHFWKVFGLAMGAAILYLGNAAISQLNSRSHWDVAVTNKRDTLDTLGWFELSKVTEQQSKAATVMLKEPGGAVSGYLAGINGDFVILATVYKEQSREEQSREERVYIPINNIHYVKLELKFSEAKK